MICPGELITMVISEDGFYKPFIQNPQLCTGCNLCNSVCSFEKESVRSFTEIADSYAIWSNDANTLKECSSGGVAYEIGKLLLSNGYKACGVFYNYITDKAEHILCNSLKEFDSTRGSKYLQSYSEKAFKEMHQYEKLVIFAAPCQIDSLRKWITVKKVKSEIVLIDFFCHGVPSYLLWNKYLRICRSYLQTEHFTYLSFRNKKYGWDLNKSFAIEASDKKRTWYSRKTDNDIFYEFYLGNYCFNEPCYVCNYKKEKSSADIRVGDLWGEKYKKHTDGVSAVVAFTEKGKSIISELKTCCQCIPETFDVVTEGQMSHSPEMPQLRKNLIMDLAGQYSLRTAYFKYIVLRKMMNKILKIIRPGNL
jgi:coenzyme F420-reducing hydrogenase beta subunit